jgi:hypothetical protein
MPAIRAPGDSASRDARFSDKQNVHPKMDNPQSDFSKSGLPAIFKQEKTDTVRG